MGSGGNWDPNQTLNGGRVKWPTGPLTDIPASQVRRVEAWVVQDTTGASQRTKQTGNFQQGRWKADEGRWTRGVFQAGPADGIAVVSWRDAKGRYHSYWWYDDINLS
jgi:hypothetical protein